MAKCWPLLDIFAELARLQGQLLLNPQRNLSAKSVKTASMSHKWILLSVVTLAVTPAE